jgi:hypothetical protein
MYTSLSSRSHSPLLQFFLSISGIIYYMSST